MALQIVIKTRGPNGEEIVGEAIGPNGEEIKVVQVEPGVFTYFVVGKPDAGHGFRTRSYLEAHIHFHCITNINIMCPFDDEPTTKTLRPVV
jgi:hypothetical protein